MSNQELDASVSERQSLQPEPENTFGTNMRYNLSADTSMNDFSFSINSEIRPHTGIVKNSCQPFILNPSPLDKDGGSKTNRALER